jgi:hypothetical protein
MINIIQFVYVMTESLVVYEILASFIKRLVNICIK